MTPIQQVQAATAIANNGAMMRPFITKKIVDPNEDKVILENEPVVAGKPISPDTAKKVRDLLRDVVTDGTGQSFAIEEYEVAGKTGTAEIPSPEGGYMKGWGNNIYSFLGMAPYDDPKLIVYVAVDRPKLEDFEPGAAVTSQLFKTIMKNSLQHLNVEPSDDPSRNDDESSNDHNGIPLANYSGIHLDEARKELEEQGFNVTTFGNNDSLITGQLPFPETSVLSGERILLKGEGDLLMPDATGWSLADLFKLAEILQLEVNIDGSGFVVKQSIPANEVVRSQDILEVSLAPPNVPEDVNRETEEEQKNE